jgi:hypothetical protein
MQDLYGPQLVGLAPRLLSSCTTLALSPTKRNPTYSEGPLEAWSPWNLETSDAEGITTGGHVHALDRAHVVRGAVVHMTCPVLSHLPVCSHVCMRPALGGPQASRQRPRARWRLRLRPCGLLARAWARPVSLPSAPPACLPGSGTLRAFAAGPPACSSFRLSCLSGAALPVARPANRLSS